MSTDPSSVDSLSGKEHLLQMVEMELRRRRLAQVVRLELPESMSLAMRKLITEGISVDEQGGQHYLDVHIAYRQACLNAIEYLKKFGYSGAQAYSILGTAPVQGHISGVVDIPNACATLWVPTEIFDFDINPSAAGPTKFLSGDVSMPLSPDL